MSGIFNIVTAQAEYAVAAMVELAFVPEGESLRSPEIARRLEVSSASLEQVMVRLRRHDLVQSFRGAQGGYALIRPADAISVAEVLSVFLGTRESASTQGSFRSLRLVVNEALRDLENALTAKARALTIADLAARTRLRNDAMAVMPGL